MNGITLEHISRPISDRLSAVDTLIADHLVSEVPLIGQIGQHIIGSGGKRIRPMLVLLCSGLIGYAGEDQHTLAAIIEYIHTATLLHDDVVDGAKLRRGNVAAHIRWSSPAAVLAGDFLYTRAFQVMVDLRCDPIMGIMAQTTNRIAQGELLQLSQVGELSVTQESLQLMARYKTAELFGAACTSAACLAGASEDVRQTLYDYGIQLGLAYQLIDDALDYTSDVAAAGKNNGTDLAEGKVTLPLLLAYARSDATEQQMIRAALMKKDRSDFDSIRQLVEASGALATCLTLAESAAQQANQCLDQFASNECHASLRGLTRFICRRIS